MLCRKANGRHINKHFADAGVLRKVDTLWVVGTYNCVNMVMIGLPNNRRNFKTRSLSVAPHKWQTRWLLVPEVSFADIFR